MEFDHQRCAKYGICVELYWLHGTEDGVILFERAPMFAQKGEAFSPVFYSQLPRSPLEHCVFLSLMPFSDKHTGLLDPPPYKSKVTREEMRYTTLARVYDASPMAPTLHPLPHIIVSNQTPLAPLPLNSGGMMVLEGRAAVQVVSSSNEYVRRDFPAETYAQAKRHVVSHF
jgi:hypothetical protein